MDEFSEHYGRAEVNISQKNQYIFTPPKVALHGNPGTESRGRLEVFRKFIEFGIGKCP